MDSSIRGQFHQGMLLSLSTPGQPLARLNLCQTLVAVVVGEAKRTEEKATIVCGDRVFIVDTI